MNYGLDDILKFRKYMSLDLDIISSKPVKHSGTGIYVRRNGQTVELKTLDEIREYFPDADISNFSMKVYENRTVWSGNITHNLKQMAKNVPINPFNNKTLCDYLWYPDILYVDQEYIDSIQIGYDYLVENKESLEKFNASNGWGTYETLLEFVESLNECLQKLIIESPDDYTISVSI